MSEEQIKRERTDQELIAACLGGEASAWENLIERYRSLIFSIPLKYGFAAHDAADIFQSVCLNLLEKLSDLRDHEKFRSWLITTVVRQCLRARRRMGIESPIAPFLQEDEKALGWEPASGSLPADEMIIEIERRHQIQRAFKKLPERCRLLLGYFFFREPPASYKEIAAETGMAFDSVGPTRTRCLEKFKLLFDREIGAARKRRSNN